MLKKGEVEQEEMEFLSIGILVPDDHLLRKVDAAVDFEFIRERVRHLYCENNGRPALDPVVLFKLLLIGYLFGIRSERQLMREVQVNAAYRWFLRMKLRDKVPDASTLSQTRRRRFRDSCTKNKRRSCLASIYIRGPGSQQKHHIQFHLSATKLPIFFHLNRKNPSILLYAPCSRIILTMNS
jgi:transposase